MEKLNPIIVEGELINLILEAKDKFNIDASISSDARPGSIGISSQVLITIMGRIGHKLGVNIPNSCYIFYDKKERKQLSIKEATQKLIKVAKDGK
jgi:hypothetical protein